jgi:Mrp family chromosome partitioning ATPase
MAAPGTPADSWEVSFEPPVFQEMVQVIGVGSPGAARQFAVPMALGRDSLVVEEFRSLGARVRSLGEEKPFRCIGVVSALGGEGKTTMALGLAYALALDGQSRILFVEADLRKPAAGRYLGIPAVSGLAEWLESTGATVPILRIVPLGFFLLQTGRGPARRPETIGSDRMMRLIAAARESFDYVVVDCPPLVPVADAVILQDLLDGFLLVVRARRSPREAILRAVSSLKPDRIQGVILNDHRELLPGYYRYAYSYYGQEP